MTAAAAGRLPVTRVYFTKFVSTLFINIILIFFDVMIVFRVYKSIQVVFLSKDKKKYCMIILNRAADQPNLFLYILK